MTISAEARTRELLEEIQTVIYNIDRFLYDLFRMAERTLVGIGKRVKKEGEFRTGPGFKKEPCTIESLVKNKGDQEVSAWQPTMLFSIMIAEAVLTTS